MSPRVLKSRSLDITIHGDRPGSAWTMNRIRRCIKPFEGTEVGVIIYRYDFPVCVGAHPVWVEIITWDYLRRPLEKAIRAGLIDLGLAETQFSIERTQY